MNMTTAPAYQSTAELLPPEGIEVETKQFEGSKPVCLTRYGKAWELNHAAIGGTFKVVVNYTPVSWREKK